MNARGQRGFSLVEVLITLAILGVAGLGMAGLQTTTLRANNAALLESQAATLAQDLIERIRANPEAGYSATFTSTVNPQDAQCTGVSVDCSPSTLRRYDIWQWKCALGYAAMSTECAAQGIHGQLPDGNGAVDTSGNVVTVTIRWFDAPSNMDRTITVRALL